MELLEDALAQVEDLRKDLSAKIIVKPRGGHWEPKGGYVSHRKLPNYADDWIPADEPEEEWVTDDPVMEPDIKKRRAAQQKLKFLHNDSKWYSVKYTTAKDLGNGSIELEMLLTKVYLPKLKEEMEASFEEEREVSYLEEEHHTGLPTGKIGGYYNVDDDEYVKVEKKEKKNFKFIDRNKRKKAVQDLGGLLRLTKEDSSVVYPTIKSMLEEVYNSKQDYYYSLEDVDGLGKPVDTGFVPELRKMAGKELGYSRPRIWVHQHPVGSLMLAGIGLTGLAYLLIEYLKK